MKLFTSVTSSHIPQHSNMEMSAFLLGQSYRDVYPHAMKRLIMVVPHAKPNSSFVEILKSGTWKRLLMYSVIVTVTSTILLTTTIAYLQANKFPLFQSAIDVINISMNDNGAIRYQKLRKADVCVLVPLTFTGLIVVNGIFSLFQSFLTVPTYERQIDTLSDLYNSSVPIITTENTWANRTITALESLTNYGGWNKKLHIVKLKGQNLYICNSSIAFPMREEYAEILVEEHQRVELRYFHLIKGVSLEQTLQVHHFRPDFPFIERINEIIYRFQSAGLFELWQRWTQRQNSHKILTKSKSCAPDIRVCK